MFPTLSYLLRYMTGWNLYLPIPTFGFFMALSFWAAYAAFTLEFRRKQRLGPIPAGIHVGRLMDRLLLCCGLIGFAGALLLAKLEDSYNLWHHPWHWLLRYHGLTYYGGLIFGAATYFYILRRRGIPLAVAADLGSPGMMLAYAIGRMGCQLAGDGDWGIVNRIAKPSWLSWAPDWTWAAHFPHNVLREGVFIPGCRGDYCAVLPDPVFPTALYESMVCLLLFLLLWGLRRKLTAPGLLFSLYALMIGLERFFVEYIRVTPRHVFLGWTLTQAQLISIGFIAIGLSGTSYILTSSAKKAYFYP
jgi:phosphatidylglycerol---prolipoprotein diacylglyceryl transferase